MDERETVTFELYLAWWYRLYAYGVVLFAYMCDSEPNWERVEYWTSRAVRQRLIEE